MSDTYTALREALAAGPTPGPWGVQAPNPSISVQVFGGRTVVAAMSKLLGEPWADANAAYIAAANPATVAALLAERDALAAEVERLTRELDAQRVYARVLCRAVDAATDFAGTVAGGASWWDDVWREHESALDAARSAISDAAKEQSND